VLPDDLLVMSDEFYQGLDTRRYCVQMHMRLRTAGHHSEMNTIGQMIRKGNKAFDLGEILIQDKQMWQYQIWKLRPQIIIAIAYAGALLDISTKRGVQALQHTIGLDDADMTATLINCNADLEHRDHYQCSASLNAIDLQLPLPLKRLLEAGVSLEFNKE